MVYAPTLSPICETRMTRIQNPTMINDVNKSIRAAPAAHPHGWPPGKLIIELKRNRPQRCWSCWKLILEPSLCVKFCKPCLDKVVFDDGASNKDGIAVKKEPGLLPSDYELALQCKAKMASRSFTIVTLFAAAVASYCMFFQFSIAFLGYDPSDYLVSDSTKYADRNDGLLEFDRDTVFDSSSSLPDLTKFYELYKKPILGFILFSIIAILAHDLLFHWKLFVANHYIVPSASLCSEVTSAAKALAGHAAMAIFAILTALMVGDRVSSEVNTQIKFAIIVGSVFAIWASSAILRKDARARLVYYCSKTRPEDLEDERDVKIDVD